MAPEEYLQRAAESQFGLCLKCVQPDYFAQLLARVRKEHPEIPHVVISRPTAFPDEVWLIPEEVYNNAKKVG